MKTKEEIIDWLKTNMVSMKDMLKICRVLQNMDIVIPSITTFNTTRKSDYSHFIKWLNSSPKTKFSIGDKVIQNTNIQNMDQVFTIQQVKQEYYGNDWHTKYILDDGRIIKEHKLSAYEGRQFDIKIGDWLRCTTTNKVFKLYAVDYSESLRCFVVGDKDAFITHTFEPYSPKEDYTYTGKDLRFDSEKGKPIMFLIEKDLGLHPRLIFEIIREGYVPISYIDMLLNDWSNELNKK